MSVVWFLLYCFLFTLPVNSLVQKLSDVDLGNRRPPYKKTELFSRKKKLNFAQIRKNRQKYTHSTNKIQENPEIIADDESLSEETLNSPPLGPENEPETCTICGKGDGDQREKIMDLNPPSKRGTELGGLSVDQDEEAELDKIGKSKNETHEKVEKERPVEKSNQANNELEEEPAHPMNEDNKEQRNNNLDINGKPSKTSVPAKSKYSKLEERAKNIFKIEDSLEHEIEKLRKMAAQGEKIAEAKSHETEKDEQQVKDNLSKIKEAFQKEGDIAKRHEKELEEELKEAGKEMDNPLDEEISREQGRIKTEENKILKEEKRTDCEEKSLLKNFEKQNPISPKTQDGPVERRKKREVEEVLTDSESQLSKLQEDSAAEDINSAKEKLNDALVEENEAEKDERDSIQNSLKATQKPRNLIEQKEQEIEFSKAAKESEEALEKVDEATESLNKAEYLTQQGIDECEKANEEADEALNEKCSSAEDKRLAKKTEAQIDKVKSEAKGLEQNIRKEKMKLQSERDRISAEHEKQEQIVRVHSRKYPEKIINEEEKSCSA